MNQSKIVHGFLIGILVAAVSMYGYSYIVKTNTSTECGSTIVTIDDVSFCVDVADTHNKRVRGLSGRKILPEGTGLLFTYNELGDYGIWMKDMNFPIDVLWMDDTLTVVHIEKNMKAESYPKVYQSKVPAQYVLEINAGEVNKNNISVGSIITIK